MDTNLVSNVGAYGSAVAPHLPRRCHAILLLVPRRCHAGGTAQSSAATCEPESGSAATAAGSGGEKSHALGSPWQLPPTARRRRPVEGSYALRRPHRREGLFCIHSRSPAIHCCPAGGDVDWVVAVYAAGTGDTGSVFYGSMLAARPPYQSPEKERSRPVDHVTPSPSALSGTVWGGARRRADLVESFIP